MEEIVKCVIAEWKNIKVRNEFLEELLKEYLHNDFGFQYDEIDDNSIYKLIKEQMDEDKKRKIARAMALNNLILLNK